MVLNLVCNEGAPFPYLQSTGKLGGRLSVNGVDKSSWNLLQSYYITVELHLCETGWWLRST